MPTTPAAAPAQPAKPVTNLSSLTNGPSPSVAVALDFDATITAIEALLPQLLATMEVVRAMGHAVPLPPPVTTPSTP